MASITAAAIVGSAVVGAVGSSISSSNASSAAGKAADTQAASDEYAADIQKQIFEEQRGDTAIARNSGNNALNQINALMGLPQSYSANSGTGSVAYTAPTAANASPFLLKGPNGVSISLTAAQKAQIGKLPAGYTIVSAPAAAYSNPNGPNSQFQTGNTQNALMANRTAAQQNFFTDPGYQFAMDQGVQAIDRSAASRGILNSGATLKALDTFGQGQADQQYGNYFARLQSLAGVGQTATGQSNQAAQNYANQASSLATQAGDARASGYINSANAFTSGINGVGNAINSGISNYFAYGGGGGGGSLYQSGSTPYNVDGYTGNVPTLTFG